MTTPTTAQIERARAIVKATLPPDRHEHCNCREEIDQGAWDSGHSMKAALAAIIDTQEACAKVAESERGYLANSFDIGPRIAAALRAGNYGDSQ